MMRRALLQIISFISMGLFAGPVSATEIPSQEVIFVKEHVLPTVLPDLGFVCYRERNQSLCSANGTHAFTAWIIPLGNRNQMPKTRNVERSLNGASEGWLLFLDLDASAYHNALQSLTDFCTPIEVYRIGTERVFLIPFRNPEHDVWIELALQVARTRQTFSPDTLLVSTIVDTEEIFNQRFPRLDRSFFSLLARDSGKIFCRGFTGWIVHVLR